MNNTIFDGASADEPTIDMKHELVASSGSAQSCQAMADSLLKSYGDIARLNDIEASYEATLVQQPWTIGDLSWAHQIHQGQVEEQPHPGS